MELTGEEKTIERVSAEYGPKKREDTEEMTAIPHVHVTLGFGTVNPTYQQQMTDTIAKAGTNRVEVPLLLTFGDSESFGSTVIIFGSSLYLKISEVSTTQSAD